MMGAWTRVGGGKTLKTRPITTYYTLLFHTVTVTTYTQKLRAVQVEAASAPHEG